MHLQLLLNALEQIAPRSFAEEWDNPGLLVEPESADITRILVALDCTVPVAREAAQKGAQLVLAHHPLFFQPVRSIYHSRPDTAAVYTLVRNGIGLYAAHTNLDSAYGGVNDALARVLGLGTIRGLKQPDEPVTENLSDIGRVGELGAEETLGAFALRVQKELLTSVRIAGDSNAVIRRVAVIGGSGGSFLAEAKAAGADVLVTGEVKHSQALDAAVYGVSIIEAGHYETECVVLQHWIARLQDAFKALQCTVDVIYADADRSPLTAP